MKIIKNGTLGVGTVNESDLELINRQARRPLTADEVYTFNVVACDDQIDRDFERFPVESLHKLAELFVGKPVISDHCWSAALQSARIYNAYVREENGVNQLVAQCYMLATGAEQTIAAIDGGILREVSVGCSIGERKCSICGEDPLVCAHIPGREYDGTVCCGELHTPTDAYELSFVAVPAQPGAGVTKSLVEKAANAEKAEDPPAEPVNPPRKTWLFENFN